MIGGVLVSRTNPPVLYKQNKVVWAPHYYNTGVYPVWYHYASTSAQEASGAFKTYVELDDETLRYNVEKTMDVMFGYLVQADKTYAMVMGELAGLYSKDAHPLKTMKRTTDFTVQVMLKEGYAGAYMWSLNPDCAYQYNPADTFGHFTEGLLQDEWLAPNNEILKGKAAMDAIKDLKRFPCFQVNK